MNIILYLSCGIIIYVICAYCLRFFMRVRYDIDFENTTDAFGSLFLMLIIFFILGSIFNKNINNLIDYCSKYSFIPIFLFLQIIIGSFILYIICIIRLCIGSILSNFKGPGIYMSLGNIFKVLYTPINYMPNKLKSFLDPFYKIPEKKSIIPIIYILKTTIFAAYLLSGIIVLSPVYNYVTGLSEAKEYLSILKNDYDTYKNVFITSLIPYFLNFAVINKKEYLKKEDSLAKENEIVDNTLSS